MISRSRRVLPRCTLHVTPVWVSEPEGQQAGRAQGHNAHLVERQRLNRLGQAQRRIAIATVEIKTAAAEREQRRKSARRWRDG